MTGPFHPDLDELPRVLPIFPLTGALLLPGGQLPLNIFEPRYLNMIRDALGGDRMIGMVQPTEQEETDDDDRPPLYPVGGAGRITSFAETDDGRFVITLTGVCRFRVGREMPLLNGYRRIEALWDRYQEDLEPSADMAIDRDRVLASARRYFERHGLQVDWQRLEKTDNFALVTALAMGCPFAPEEKQAILEADDGDARAKVLTALLDMSGFTDDESDQSRH